MKSPNSTSTIHLDGHPDYTGCADEFTPRPWTLPLLESLPEVDHVDVIQKKEGKRIVDAVYHIFPSESFISSIIEANQLNKRAKNALIDRESEQVLIEPLEHEYPNRRAFEEAKRDYDVRKGKILYARRHLPSI